MSQLDKFRKEIVAILGDAGYKIDKDVIETPKKKDFGDFAVPCFQFSKEMRKSPFEIALELKGQIKLTDSFERVINEGPYL
ncbi:MAG: arginine--tRNA ligase, partial [Nanoarchaeota archaeon]